MQKTKNKTYSAEFKAAAVKQANESELPVSETARNLGVNVNTLFTWIQKYSQPVEKNNVKRTDAPLYEEVKRLKKEVTRLTQERDILKKAAAYFASEHW
jgi:transposase